MKEASGTRRMVENRLVAIHDHGLIQCAEKDWGVFVALIKWYAR